MTVLTAAFAWIASIVLHAGAHATESGASASFEWWYVAASIVLVGSVGGSLYWYFQRRVRGT